MRNGTRSSAARGRSWNSQLVTFAAVSAACTAAAVGTGTEAFWRSRRRMADDALTSVHDLLETCRDRVSRMEAELSLLSASPSAAPGPTQSRL